MKRTILGLILAFACLGYAPKVHAAASRRSPPKPESLQYARSPSPPILLTAGQGAIYGVDCSSGTTTSYAMLFDSATSSGITIATLGKALTPQIFSSGQTAANVPDSGWRPGTGSTAIAYNNGIVIITHGSAINCLVRTGPLQGSTP